MVRVPTARIWPQILEAASRNFATVVDDGDLSEARAWARIICGILAAETEGTAEQRAWLDALEESMLDDGPACEQCSQPIPKQRLLEYPGAKTCSEGCSSARRLGRTREHARLTSERLCKICDEQVPTNGSGGDVRVYCSDSCRAAWKVLDALDREAWPRLGRDQREARIEAGRQRARDRAVASEAGAARP